VDRCKMSEWTKVEEGMQYNIKGLFFVAKMGYRKWTLWVQYGNTLHKLASFLNDEEAEIFINIEVIRGTIKQPCIVSFQAR